MVPLIVGHRDAIERRVFAQREELAALNGELARLNEEKNEFMAITAHDRRAPLATVRGLAEQLEAGRFAGAAQGRAHGAIRDLSERMLGLVNDYLGVHAAESGTLPVRSERLDLAAAARAAGERHVAAAAAKGQRIKVGASEPVWVRADGALLAQVVDNFVGNALKFSPRGAEVRLDLARAPSGGEVRLEVSDEGPGIAAAEQAGLFRKFGRASAKPTGGETSHGLGLAVAKRLAEAMGGSVGCESPVNAGGTGARFWVRLPGEV